MPKAGISSYCPAIHKQARQLRGFFFFFFLFFHLYLKLVVKLSELILVDEDLLGKVFVGHILYVTRYYELACVGVERGRHPRSRFKVDCTPILPVIVAIYSDCCFCATSNLVTILGRDQHPQKKIHDTPLPFLPPTL